LLGCGLKDSLDEILAMWAEQPRSSDDEVSVQGPLEKLFS